MIEENKQLVAKFIELAWNQGRFNLAKALVSRDFTYQANMVKISMNFDLASKAIEAVRNAMDDFEVMPIEIIAEGNKVVSQSSFCGTLVKPLYGFKPSDKVITFTAVSFWEIKHGHITSVNTTLDYLELSRQMLKEDKVYELIDV